MARTGAAAIAAANGITTGYGGMCLKFVRTVFAVPAKYATARDARTHAAAFHATSNPAAVPAGVPVFLGDNHVAVSMGGGMMRTTNSVTNKVATVSIASWGKSYPLRGWSEDLNGVRVYTAPAAAKPAAAPAAKPAAAKPAASSGLVLKSGSTGQHVTNLQSGLRRVFPAYASESAVKRGQLIGVDGSFGPQTQAWVELFQSKTGLAKDGVVGAATTAALARYGIAL